MPVIVLPNPFHAPAPSRRSQLEMVPVSEQFSHALTNNENFSIMPFRIDVNRIGCYWEEKVDYSLELDYVDDRVEFDEETNYKKNLNTMLVFLVSYVEL